MNKKRHLVRTIVDSTPYTTIFTSKKKTEEFIKKFSKKYKGKEMNGWWIDLIVYDIQVSIIDDNKVL